MAAEDPIIYQRCRTRPQNKDNNNNNSNDNGKNLASSAATAAECELCDKKKYPQTSVPNVTKVEDRFHVVIQLTTNQLESELLAITASLLHEHKAYVSLFFMDFTRTDITRQDYVQLLFQRILVGVPCADHSILQSRLAIRSISMPPTVKEYCSETILNYYHHHNSGSGRTTTTTTAGGEGRFDRRRQQQQQQQRRHRRRLIGSTTTKSKSSYWEPLQSCNVLMATSQYRAYGSLWIDSTNQRIEYPISVVVTDRFGLGALLLAEEWGVPSIMLTDETSLRRATQQQPSSSSSFRPSFFQLLRTLPNEIWRSLSGIISFAGLQQLRKALGLKRIRYRNEIWNAVTAILVLTTTTTTTTTNNNNNEPTTTIANTLLPPLLPIQHPIFPPCLACNPNDNTSEKPKTTTTTEEQQQQIPVVSVIVFQNPNTIWTASQQRKILRGLAKARKSLLLPPQSSSSSAVPVSESCPSTLSNCWHERSISSSSRTGTMELQVQWLLHNHDREGLQAAAAAFTFHNNNDKEEAVFSNHSLVAPLPDFVVTQDAMLFTDIILQSTVSTTKNPTIVLAPCEDNNARAAMLLQIPTLCFLPPSSSSYHHRHYNRNNYNLHYFSLQHFDEHEIAQQLLRLVWTWKPPSEGNEPPTTHDNSTTATTTSRTIGGGDDDAGLQRVVAAIRTAGSLRPIQQIRKSDPKLPQELQLFYSQIMISRGEMLLLSQRQQEGLSSLLMMSIHNLLKWTSWAVLVSMFLYFGTRRFLPRLPRHIRRNIETIRSRFCLDAIRVSEVDKALEAVGSFWKDIRSASDRQQRGGEEKTLTNGNRSNFSDKNNHNKQSNSGRTNNHSNKKRMGKHR